MLGATTTRPAEHAVEVRFVDGPGVMTELQALVAAEQVCCPSYLWTVSNVGDGPVLRVAVSVDSGHSIEALAALFGATRSA